MAEVYGGGSASAPPLPLPLPLPPRPKSPPALPDLGGKRKHMAKAQMLEREIDFLQEELRAMEDSQPASRSCKEIADFVVANSDPLMPTKRRKNRNASGSFWSWLCGMACFNSSCVCCSCRSECSCHLKCPTCLGTCLSCSSSLFQCLSCFRACRCERVSCGRTCWFLGLPLCGDCSCCICRSSCFDCSKYRLRCGCRNLCCNPC